MIFDVDQAQFSERVVQRSRQVPVVVDFWAEWCGPCKALSPALERAASARDGEVDLAKVDVDRNPALAQSYRVQGIPSVKAFRNGAVTDEFTGAISAQQVEQFFDRLVPSEAERLAEQGAASGDEQALRRALELDSRNLRAATALARLLLQRDDTDGAAELLEPFEFDFGAAGLRARAQLQAAGDDATAAFGAWDRSDHQTALELLHDELIHAGDERREQLRRVMVAIFAELGSASELASRYRRKLAAALN